MNKIDTARFNLYRATNRLEKLWNSNQDWSTYDDDLAVAEQSVDIAAANLLVALAESFNP